MCFVFSPVVYLFYPETANRTLEDMDQIFIHNPSAFVFKNKAATQSQRPQLFVDAETARIAQASNNVKDDALPGSEMKEKVTSRERTLDV